MEKVYHVIRVFPDTMMIDRLPKALIKKLKEKGRIQDKHFTVVIRPLSQRLCRIMSAHRYADRNIIRILNECIYIDGDVKLKYVLKWPLLIKLIVDEVYRISTGAMDEFNNDPEKLFEALKKSREGWNTYGALLDQMMVSSLGPDRYIDLDSKFQSVEEKLSIAALMELTSDVIIEERYRMAQKMGTPIKLAPDKRFRKEYADKFGNKTVEAAEESKMALQEQMAKDKKLGVKRRINTETENRSLQDM